MGFVIAEGGSCHDNKIENAFRLIEVAKECGADACKWQYWSSAKRLAQRRGLPALEAAYQKYQLPQDWLPKLKAHSDKVGIEFMCSTFLIEDIAVVAPLVSRFKVSAFEATWDDFIVAHPRDRSLLVSSNPGQRYPVRSAYTSVLHCVSKYPTPVEELHLYRIDGDNFNGFSDHSVSTVTGALAAIRGAAWIEKHIRLFDTGQDCPDFEHSLVADTDAPFGFKRYVDNIREAERAL